MIKCACGIDGCMAEVDVDISEKTLWFIDQGGLATCIHLDFENTIQLIQQLLEVLLHMAVAKGAQDEQ